MSQKEAIRAQVMELLTAGTIDQKEAGKRLSVSVRQIKRIVRRYRTEGLSGLTSKKRGIPSNRRLNEVTKRLSIELIGTHYRDFGPTLAREKLFERHDITLSVERTRQLMIESGFWKPRKGVRVCVHPMRERRARLGELIQIDGSPHDWLEGRGEYCTLLVFIDDATGKLMQLRFTPTETTLGYMHVLHDHIAAHGLPAALYSDKHGVFRINTKDVDAEAETPFSRAARELGIACIHANSPQAKGREERANQTLQDRLVKEMRLAGINNMVEANDWLPAYIADYNRRLAVVPKNPQDAHLPYHGTTEELTRTLSVQVIKNAIKESILPTPGGIDTSRVQRHGTGYAGSQSGTTPTL